MFNFDEPRFLRIQKGAVDLAPRIDQAIGAAIANGATNLYFLGTGGVAYLMEPAVQLLHRRSGFPVYKDYPAELVLTGSANLTAKSIVVFVHGYGADAGRTWQACGVGGCGACVRPCAASFESTPCECRAPLP